MQSEAWQCVRIRRERRVTQTAPCQEPTMINANEIAFGVEIETTLPASNDTPIGGYHRGLPVAWLPQGWKAERDGSIRQSYGRKACEFVSPKLKGEEGLREVTLACDAIKAAGGKVNETCGIHVTVTFDGDAAALARLVNLVGNHEKALYAVTGTHRREQGSYAKGLKRHGSPDAAKRNADYDRFHMLNLTHVAAGKNRVEFRVFSGSLNDDKIRAWIQLCLGLVALSQNQKRKTSWDYASKPGKSGPWARSSRGAGETEVNRLFYRLGWTKGHSPKVWGLISEDGRKLKKTLRTLAQKYDREA